jgi:Ca2+-binding RTX toxin-like protein
MATLLGTQLGDSFNGMGGNDILIGASGIDSLNGLGGDDVLDGGADPDNLTGGDGNDYLIGSDGNDVLIGGAGNDVLAGGVGSDYFVFTAPSEGVDFFTDFRAAEGDKLVISTAGFGLGAPPNPAQFSFDAGSGSVFFDAVPNDAIAPVQFAGLLQNLGFGGLNPAADILFF